MIAHPETFGNEAIFNENWSKKTRLEKQRNQGGIYVQMLNSARTSTNFVTLAFKRK
jgi:hypothetical protein